jgi:hypothetical protein
MSKPKAEATVETAADMLALLRARYPSNAFAFLEQVGNSTGFACSRWADVVVMSLWPSRGLEIIGIEIKVSRSDWKRELEHPEKADPIAAFCDRWYLAAGSKDIVQPGELPLGWGLLVPNGPDSLRCTVEASLNPEPRIDRQFLAAVLRRVQAQLTEESKLKAEYERGIQAGRAAELKVQERSGAVVELRDLREEVDIFEKAAGIKITGWGGENIGEAVRLLRAGKYWEERNELQRLRDELSRIGEQLDAALKESPVETGQPVKARTA